MAKGKAITMGDGNKYLPVRVSVLSKYCEEVREKLRYVQRSIVGDSAGGRDQAIRKCNLRMERLVNMIDMAQSMVNDMEVPLEKREHYFQVAMDLEGEYNTALEEVQRIEASSREETERIMDYVVECAVWALQKPPHSLEPETAYRVATPEYAFPFVAAMLGLVAGEQGDDEESPLPKSETN